MPDAQGRVASATAEVIRGGNRTLEVRVPVEIRIKGQPWWRDEAVVRLQIPAGAEMPDVEVPINTSPKVREVPRDD